MLFLIPTDRVKAQIAPVAVCAFGFEFCHVETWNVHALCRWSSWILPETIVLCLSVLVLTVYHNLQLVPTARKHSVTCRPVGRYKRQQFDQKLLKMANGYNYKIYHPLETKLSVYHKLHKMVHLGSYNLLMRL